jgi:hypothetical protein
MFYPYPFSRQLSVVLFLFFTERLLFTAFIGQLTMGMQFSQALVSSVCLQQD